MVENVFQTLVGFVENAQDSLLYACTWVTNHMFVNLKLPSLSLLRFCKVASSLLNEMGGNELCSMLFYGLLSQIKKLINLTT